ncbi:MAG: hypothetical protein AABZ53_16950 [Planctomycetota bacterium]|mgnify:CR=1 FL=1
MFSLFRKQPAAPSLEWNEFTSRPFSGRTSATADSIDPILTRFIAEPPDSSAFLILTITPQTYLQAARRPTGFVLEYQFDDTDQHFECTENVTPELLSTLFHLYLDNPAGIVDLAAWKKLDL